jgi:hypothetical protein
MVIGYCCQDRRSTVQVKGIAGTIDRTCDLCDIIRELILA